MQNHQQDQPSDPLKDARDTISAGIGLAQAFAMPVRVWWTRFGSAGEMFFGGRMSVIGWLMLPFWPCFITPFNARVMTYFWLLTTLLLLAHRIRHWMLRRKGYRPHSLFVGASRLDRFGNDLSRRVLEPIITAVIGGLILGWDKALGLYLVWASIAMVVSTGYGYAVQESMVPRMYDARAEQEWMAEQMRRSE